MIAINLLPGAKRKRAKGGGIALPNVGAMLAAVKDPWLVAAIAAWVVVGGLGTPLYLRRQSQVRALEPRLQTAKRDSVTYAGILNRRHRMEQTRDSLLAEMQYIRDIDRDRYVWPHILDAVAKALPDYTWLDDLSGRTAEGDTAVGGGASFTVQGKTAGEAQAVTRFMRNLEESPFVEGVTLVSSAMVTEQGRDVTSFTLNAHYQMPSPSILAMEPLAASIVQGVRSGGGTRR
ncbi:MAG TPA: PilN domain-containing protein [Gemmatimonadales bacterium]|nr:PilN domain-containing protein [Gemmatimonadales bacterium]